MSSLLTERTPVSIVLAQAVGITSSLYLLGTNVSLSFISCPAALIAPAPLAARQWELIYNKGKALGLPLSLMSAFATAYVAYKQDPKSLPFKLNLAATILMPGIIPFTLFFIKPVNDRLFAKSAELASASLEDKAIEANVAQGETVHALIDKWATLNLARAVLIGSGAICAVLAGLSKRELVGFSEVALKSGANRM